jgi:hypothetical protein
LEFQLYTSGRVPDLGKLPDPRLLATHVPFVALPRSVVTTSDPGCNCKVVYVCRDQVFFYRLKVVDIFEIYFLSWGLIKFDIS